MVLTMPYSDLDRHGFCVKLFQITEKQRITLTCSAAFLWMKSTENLYSNMQMYE